MINYDVPVNSRMQNANIKGHILDKEQMEALGFLYNENSMAWIYSKTLYNEDYFFCKITDNDIEIMILDDNFCQPYDYQNMLHGVDHEREKNTNWYKYAMKVHNKVQEIMAKLVEGGVISGYERNDFI